MNEKTRAFCSLLNEAIADEKVAPKIYFKLKRDLPNDYACAVLAGKTVDKIVEDEISHHNLLTTIKRQVCEI